MNRTVVCAAALCVLLGGIAGAQVLGTIDYMEGSVSISRNGETVKHVDIGTKVENLDIVKTSSDGEASIVFDRQSGLSGNLQLVPGTTAIIRQDQISGSGASEIQLLAGSVNLKVKRLVKGDSSIQVRTPTSILGVRGTEFVVSTFNGSSIVACKEGEVFCATSSDLSVSRLNLSSSNGASAVPGTMVEIIETGKVSTGEFPPGDFDANWKEVRAKWLSFNVGIIAEDPVAYLDKFANNWTVYATKAELSAKTLRSNAVLKKWLKDASAGTVSGSLSTWVKEKPVVMKDLIALRPDMMIALITWSRLQDVLPYIPSTSMGEKLSNGQTIQAFAAQVNRQAKTVFSAVTLFNAAEKLYMQRNDGLSPFSVF